MAALIVTDAALATHYARRAVVDICGLRGLDALKVEPNSLLLLTKLVAAAENECARASGGVKVRRKGALVEAARCWTACISYCFYQSSTG